MRRYEKLLLLAVCIATFFVNNWVIVPDIMESRNLITAREMVYDGHWLIPTMNGELRLEKPPLPTWIAAVVEMVSPDDIVSQRAMAGLAALLLVFYVWQFSKKVLQVDPLLPTLLLCTCYNVILMGRTVSWDIYCHAFMMGGIYHLTMRLRRAGPQWGQLLLAGVWMGLSLMSKGPVSLYALLLPFLICYGYMYRPSLRGKALPLVAMVVVALAVGSWWYIYVYLHQAETMAYVVSKESGSWVNYNVRPWYYYWKFFLESGVWSLLLLSALIVPAFCRECRRRKEWMLALAWTLCILVLLSCLPEKKSRYLLPILIPSAMTMAFLLERWQERFTSGLAKAGERVLFRVNAWLLAVAVLAVPVAIYLFAFKPGLFAGPVLLGVVSVVFVAIALYIIYSAHVLRPRGLLYGVTAVFVAAECMVLPFMDKVINNPERHSIAATRYIEALQSLPFYYNSAYELRIETVLHTYKKVRPLDFYDEEAVMQALPCAVLTETPLQEEMPAALLDKIDVTFVDRYDDNPRPKNQGRHASYFIHHVNILTAKNP